jgi:vacuolar-type H+-ATPase subunit H
MTDKTSEQQPADTAETAMNRVLEAEQAAARAINDSEREANAILQAARQRARRIARRTDERITLINQQARQRLQQRLADAEREEHLAEREREHDRRAALVDDVVTALAAGLTGGVDGD